MMFLRFDRGLYAYVFIGVVLFVHGYAIYDDPSAVPILALVLAMASFAFCMKMCQEDDYGYLAGFENLARRHAGPIVQLTAILLVPVFYVLHLFCVLICLIGIFRGREFTLRVWGKVTERHRGEQVRATH